MNASRRQARGYSLVEVLVAASLMAMAVGAAASLSLGIAAQEEIQFRNARGLNTLESAVRLYQLGLSPVQARALLPPDPIIIEVRFTTGLTPLGGSLGSVEHADIAVRYRTSPAGQLPVRERTETVRAFRQTIPLAVP